jgi:type IV pilus assembly protein PilN
MIKINLLSEGKRPAAVRKAKTTALLEGKDIGMYLLALGLVLGLVASVFYWWTLKGQVDEQQEAIQEAQHQVDKLGAVIKEVENYKGKKAELERKIGIINDLKANQRGPVRVMDYVSRALPELLWLDRMSMNASTIEIEGRAFNTNAVATFIENLDKVPEFEEPTLKDTSEQAGGVYKFVISFNYSFTPPKTEGAANGGTTPSASGPAASARPTSG